jgi:hypothetical protein
MRALREIRQNLSCDWCKINQQYFESKNVPSLEQEINLHISVIAETCKLLRNCVVLPVCLVCVCVCVHAWCPLLRCGFSTCSLLDVQRVCVTAWSRDFGTQLGCPFVRWVFAFFKKMLVMDDAYCVLLVRPSHNSGHCCSPVWRLHVHSTVRRTSGRSLGTFHQNDSFCPRCQSSLTSSFHFSFIISSSVCYISLSLSLAFF